MEREDAGFMRRIIEAEDKQKTLRARYAAQLLDLERALATARRNIAENEARRLTEVRAPANGTATAVLGEVGQLADPSRPLLAIVPEHAVLEAKLLAPTRTVGFIRPGSAVMLRYDAYPYQRFGHHRGMLQSVSGAAVATTESVEGSGEEPVYQAIVTLPAQTVLAYGERHRLQAGMTVQADVLQDTRRLYEWALEPLYSITGKLHRESQGASAESSAQ
jgi:membrane fusion protein